MAIRASALLKTSCVRGLIRQPVTFLPCAYASTTSYSTPSKPARAHFSVRASTRRRMKSRWPRPFLMLSQYSLPNVLANGLPIRLWRWRRSNLTYLR